MEKYESNLWSVSKPVAETIPKSFHIPEINEDTTGNIALASQDDERESSYKTQFNEQCLSFVVA